MAYPTEKFDIFDGQKGIVYVNEETILVSPNEWECIWLMAQGQGEIVSLSAMSLHLFGFKISNRDPDGSVNADMLGQRERVRKAINRAGKRLPDGWVKLFNSRGCALIIPGMNPLPNHRPGIVQDIAEKVKKARKLQLARENYNDTPNMQYSHDVSDILKTSPEYPYLFNKHYRTEVTKTKRHEPRLTYGRNG